MLTYTAWDQYSLSFEKDDETKGALSVLRWAYEHYGHEIVYACSFGIEGIVLLHFIQQVKSNAKIVFLDTGLHFPETYETIEKIKQRFPDLQIIMKKPNLSVDEQGKKYGEELWKTNPNECCRLRKIVPLEEALREGKAWISGLRREQSQSRSKTEFINRDNKFKSIKICPLIYWTWRDVWRYVSKHQLPYNTLHDKGYPSIGCQPCTSPLYTEEDLRSGRWAGTGKTECGLHE
ncbi:phosphoadenylyl-sulfate reductase [Bacillus sp. 165]|uniref:phosphoadenylyl-sulfate reductase n=1 Tax=Bacillus sp. 165 TaxID=1529117 RepID=UPI001ADC00F2|nr:phosphoadenylyl-sulfate reductase [Bacillus sp. 165]MBO9128345.1 phosphoadenylyl-sulfate reductase [Bacillus sp. 165]